MPSMLSDVLAGKKNLSSSSALQVAQRLALDTDSTEQFTTLVLLESEKSEERRALLQKRLEAFAPNRARDLSLDVFLAISEWYHFAILELTYLERFPLTPANIAKKLGISKLDAAAAIERLERLELLEQDAKGRYRKVNDNIIASAKAPNEALRKYHRQMLIKAIDSLETQTPKEKIIGSETLAFSKAHLKEANEAIEACFTKLFNLSRKQGPRDEVYHLGIQFFRLTERA